MKIYIIDISQCKNSLNSLSASVKRKFFSSLEVNGIDSGEHPNANVANQQHNRQRENATSMIESLKLLVDRKKCEYNDHNMFTALKCDFQKKKGD